MTLIPYDVQTYPFQDLLGFRLLEWRQDYAKFELPLTAQLTNRSGLPHGGIYATLLDTAMGFSGVFSPDPAQPRYAVTLSLTTNFLSRPMGDRLIAEGWKIGGGASSFFTEGKIFDDHGTLCTTASATFRYRKGG